MRSGRFDRTSEISIARGLHVYTTPLFEDTTKQKGEQAKMATPVSADAAVAASFSELNAALKRENYTRAVDICNKSEGMQHRRGLIRQI
jgi:hypothetical protein